MSRSTDRQPVQSADLVLATALLVGISVTGYGYFQGSKIALYAGLFTTLAGVIVGTIRIVAR